MRKKEDLEREFNKEAKKYNILAFTAKEFDNDSSLKKAFSSFENYKKELNSDYQTPMMKTLGIKSLDTYWLTYLHNKSNREFDDNLEYEANIVEYVKSLFNITNDTLAKKIACKEYFDIMQCYFNPEDKNDYLCNINDSIEKWLLFRESIYIKMMPFLNSRYPRWKKAAKDEKTTFIADIKKLRDDLSILNINNDRLNYICSYLDKYDTENKNDYCANFLASQNLPNINYKIAHEIIKYTKRF